MENCLNSTEIYYKDIEEYKSSVNDIIQNMISKSERLAFAVVAERAGITPFVIRRYPEIRTYVLQRMVHYKEIHVINQKIDRAVNNLLKANKRVTFIELISRCRFGPDMLQNQYIRDRIRSVLAVNSVKNI